MAYPRTRVLRPFTNHIFNPVSRLVAGHLPWFAILRHVGRTSGKRYRTPLNVFRVGDDRVFALTYGRDVYWVQNVLAAGECEIEERGRVVRLRDPRLFEDPSRHLMPLPVRFVLGLLRVNDFLRLSPA